MKKFLAILLVCAFAFSLAACSSSSDESSAPTFNAGNNSTPKEEPSKAESSEVSKPETSTPETPETPAAKTITQFVSWGKAFYNNIVAATSRDATSLPLHKLNAAVAEGENGAFTFGNAIALAEGADIKNFALVTFKYDHTVFGYVKNEVQEFGAAKLETVVPEDGFALVIGKGNEGRFTGIKATKNETIFYPHGFVINNKVDATITKTAKAPEVDGKVSAEEYGEAVWVANPSNELYCYGLFDAGKYNVTANVYMTYDAENLYLGVVVDTPDHFNNLAEIDWGGMYDYTCIQVDVMGISPRDESIVNGAWDYRNTNMDIALNNVLRKYGFGYNPETQENQKTMWGGKPEVDNSVTVNSREGQITTYEVKIPWADFGSEKAPVEIKEGSQIGVNVSINSGSDEKPFQVLCIRDGGGTIGINDLSKIPVITLG